MSFLNFPSKHVVCKKNAVISLAPLPIQGLKNTLGPFKPWKDTIREGSHQCVGGVSAMPVHDLWMFSSHSLSLIVILCICSGET